MYTNVTPTYEAERLFPIDSLLKNNIPKQVWNVQGEKSFNESAKERELLTAKTVR